MAKTSAELFTTFASRTAEILREHFGMSPETVLRVDAARFTVEGLVRDGRGGGPDWYCMTATPERLEWSGPEALAKAFVRNYRSLFELASPVVVSRAKPQPAEER